MARPVSPTASESSTPWIERPGAAAGFNAVSAVSAAVSAGIALWAIKISIAATKEERSFRKNQKRESYFALYVTDAALKAVRHFSTQAAKSVTDCIATLDANSTVKGFDVYSPTSMAAAQFQESFLVLKSELFFVTQAWPDSSLWHSLQAQLYSMEDEVLLKIDQLVVPSTRHDGIDDLIRVRAAGLLRTLLAYDEEQHSVKK